MSLSAAAQAMNARLDGDDGNFDGVSTDTRTLRRGELFCAIRGPRFDGHDHCSVASARGAAGAIVEEEIDTGLPQLVVDDSRAALGRLAAAWRSRFAVPLIGITGSNGKTTVKEMIAVILRTNARVLSTEGNLNNDIGVAKTLYRLDDSYDYVVLEMGASAVGEIAWLTEIAQPVVGVVTLVAPAHLEGFGSLERVAQAKGELYAGLIDGGTAIINADDPFAAYWQDVAAKHRRLRFGHGAGVDVGARNVRQLGIGKGCDFVLTLPGDEIEITLPFDGTHNVTNALAAATVAHALDVDAAAIKTGLEACQKVAGRLNVRDCIRGARLIDDTYNANPASLNAALEVLSGVDGDKWLVLGDMGELGENALQIHRDAGESARRLGAARLFTLGPLSAAASKAFGNGAQHFEDVDALVEALTVDLDDAVTILVKGSRYMRMERVTRALGTESGPC